MINIFKRSRPLKEISSSLHPLSGIAVLFNRQWWWATLLVMVAMMVMVRLGLWQLDRLAQRRELNAQVAHRLVESPLPLTGSLPLENVSQLEYRAATVSGEYDYSRQIALKNQAWQGQPGVHLITPLLIKGSNQAVLVDRGWVPYQQGTPEQWAKFNSPGAVDIQGAIRLSQARPEALASSSGATSGNPETPQTAWFRVNIPAIQTQMPYQLLPVYIQQQSPGPAGTNLPYRSNLQLDLSEGPHLGYALQWFSFTIMLGIGYIYFVRKYHHHAG